MRIRIECILAFSIFAGLLPSFAQKPPKLPKDLPAYGPLKPFVPPQIVEKTMPNGMTVWLVPRPGYPKVALALAIRGGLANDPETMPGLSELLASMVTLGTKSRTAKQIAQEIAAAGGDLSTVAGKDDIIISTDVPSWTMQKGLGILADVAQNAEFPEAQVTLAQRNATDELRVNEAKSSFLAFRAVNKAVFGSNPYGVFAPTVASIAKTNRNVLRHVYSQRFQPNQAILVVVGDFLPNEMMTAIHAAFEKWTMSPGEATPSVPQPQPLISHNIIYLVDRPSSVQTTIVLGSIGPTQRDPDYPAFEVSNTLYGGMFSARLSSNIRENKGYSYGAGSLFQPWAQTALFLSAANVRNPVTGATLNEFEYELNRMATTTPRPDELESAERHLIGTQALRMQSQEALASQFCSLWSVGLVPSDLEHENAEILKVTLGDVTTIGRKYFPAFKQTIVMVGDRKAISEQVAPFGLQLQVAP